MECRAGVMFVPGLDVTSPMALAGSVGRVWVDGLGTLPVLLCPGLGFLAGLPVARGGLTWQTAPAFAHLLHGPPFSLRGHFSFCPWHRSQAILLGCEGGGESDLDTVRISSVVVMLTNVDEGERGVLWWCGCQVLSESGSYRFSALLKNERIQESCTVCSESKQEWQISLLGSWN